MDDDSPANHLIQRETTGQERGERQSIVSKQRWHIPSVVRMRTVI